MLPRRALENSMTSFSLPSSSTSSNLKTSISGNRSSCWRVSSCSSYHPSTKTKVIFAQLVRFCSKRITWDFFFRVGRFDVRATEQPFGNLQRINLI
jgi:hypothetical protein